MLFRAWCIALLHIGACVLCVQQEKTKSSHETDAGILRTRPMREFFADTL